jgi:hypothetical protein
MMPLIIGITGCVIALLAIALRHEKPWPRDGHGQTYFIRSSQH